MTTLLLATTLASILLFTALAWLVRWALWPRLCPLCAGVAGTWLALLAAHAAGWALDLRLPALLLGGSVVGLAGLGEKALAGRSRATVLAWKTVFVLSGFATAYGLLLAAWPGVAAGGAVMAGLLALPWLRASAVTSGPSTQRREEVMAQLRNCC